MRIQLDVDDNGVQLLEWLKQKTNSKTQKELFNNAMTLLTWAVTQRSQGRIIASLDEQNERYRELQMPALEYAAPKPPVPSPPVAAASG
jgi:hypothetical protein